MTVQWKYAAFSDVGLIRKSNQDAGYASPNLLVLADGMGGAAGGDIASSVVVSSLAETDDVHNATELLPLLRAALNDAHEDLIRRSEESADLQGLGTTCIAMLRTSNKIGMVHIGDSRAYLLRGGKLTQVTKDHTLVQFLVDQGQLTPEEAENHPKRNVIMRAVGDSPETLELDESIREAIPGDRWLLSSDGLFGVVTRETIERVLIDYEDIDACGEHLIELALAAGAPDNVTVVLADLVPTADAPADTDRGVIVVGSAAVDAQKPSRAGTSAAGQATSLRFPQTVNDAETVAEPEPEQRRRPWAGIAAGLGLIVAIIAGALAGYSWTQTQYYVSQVSGKVAIYQGIPQEVGPIKLSSVHEVTDIHVKDLTAVAQRRLDTPITRGSLEAAEKVVTDLDQQRVAEEKPTEAPRPQPSASPDTKPSPSPSAKATPSAKPSPSPTPTPSATPSPSSTGAKK